MKLAKLQSNRGFATLIALVMVGMLMLIGLAALSTSEDEIAICANAKQETRAFYAAEAGLEKAAASLQTVFDTTGEPPVEMPYDDFIVNDCAVEYECEDNGPAEQRPLTKGTLAGLHALVKSYTITSSANSSVERAKIQMTESFETALVPIFQFAIFYGNDLEIAPGPAMSLLGRVHSNGNLWVQSGNTLSMDSYMTASGSILHGRKGGGGVASGDVLIKDAAGNYRSMKEGGDWLDASSTNWYDSSVARWNGRVQDSAHGQEELNLPLTDASNPHAMIERANGNPDSYEDKATLKFVDDTAWALTGGTWTDVTADMITKGIIEFKDDQFTDQREGELVDVMEMDMWKLYDEGYGPDNGVIYFSSQVDDFPAIRLHNGSEITDAQGLTIVSENPLYTCGDFNSVNKVPMALMADAITFLSNNWDAGNFDSKSALYKSNRVAANTTVNCSYLTGNTETTASNYNGGFENLPRFLEVWSSKGFNWSGSAVNLWYSQQANALWSGSYYSPPLRNWAYDSDLDNPANLPPESPTVRVFQRIGWSQAYVGYETDPEE